MTYDLCIDYLYTRLPMYQRDGGDKIKIDLHKIEQLCLDLDNPHEKFRNIHVAGTNGKGSVCHILSAILQARGLKVGLHTSPHYLDFRERIRINGKKIPKKNVIDFVQMIESSIQRINPSFFELTVAMAFDFFASEKVDLAVIETGLGGRLDSTNIVTPVISIITNIGLDHQSMLGDSVEKIAREKGGIIKYEIPIVIGKRDKKTDQVFKRIAKAKKAPIYFAQDLLKVQTLDSENDHLKKIEVDNLITGVKKQYETHLMGGYQLTNIRTALAAMQILRDNKVIDVNDESITQGIRNVEMLTGMMGRWQKLQESPLVVTDSGHNPTALHCTAKQLSNLTRNGLHVVFGISKEKDLTAMLTLLPREAHYYWCAADLPRSQDPVHLEKVGKSVGLVGKSHISVKSALEKALENAEKKECIFIGGSVFVVGEALDFFDENS